MNRSDVVFVYAGTAVSKEAIHKPCSHRGEGGSSNDYDGGLQCEFIWTFLKKVDEREI